MNQVSLVCVFCLTAICGNTFADDFADNPVAIRVIYSSNNSVCRKAEKILGQIPRIEIWGHEWKKAFGSVEWGKDSYPSINADGGVSENEYEFKAVDLNNDGKNEVVIKEVRMLSSILYEHLWVVGENEFLTIKTNRQIMSALQKLPQFSPRNVAVFTNGKRIEPIQIHIWMHGERNYILMKELWFASEKRKFRASMYVAELRGELTPSLGVFGDASFIPHMICQFKEK